MPLVHDDVVDVLVEPGIKEGPESLLALVVPPTVLDQPFLRDALLEVDSDNRHHVSGPRSAESLPLGFGQVHFDSEQGLVVKELVFHQAVLGRLVDPHIHPEGNRFVGEDCLEANLLDCPDLEVHEVHLVGTHRAVLFLEDVMLPERPVGGMEQAVIVGKLETDGLLEKTLRGVFFQNSQLILFYPLLTVCLCLVIFLVSPLELGGRCP